MNFGGSDKNIAKGKYGFGNWTMPEVMAERLVKFYKQQGFKKIAFVGVNEAGVQTIETAFSNIAIESDIETNNFYFSPNEKDFRILLLKTKEYNPDAYMVMVWGGQTVPFFKQMKEAGINKPITNIEIFSMIKDFSIIEGSHFTDVSQTSSDFWNRLKTAYPDTASEFATGNIYDNIMLLVQSFEMAENKENAVDALGQIKNYTGVNGSLWQDETGVFHSNAVLKKVINGKPVVVEK